MTTISKLRAAVQRHTPSVSLIVSVFIAQIGFGNAAAQAAHTARPSANLNLASPSVPFVAAQNKPADAAADVAAEIAPRQIRPRLTTALQTALASAQPADRLNVIVRLSSPTVADSKGDVVRATVRPYIDLNRPAAIAQRSAMVNAMQTEATAAQQNVLGALQSPELQAQVDHIRPFWIFNGFAVRATPAVIRILAERNDIESIQIDEWRRWVNDVPFAEPAIEPAAEPAAKQAQTLTQTFTQTLSAMMSDSASPQDAANAVVRAIKLNAASPISLALDSRLAVQVDPPAPGTVAWGVERIRADQVWNGLGINGSGIVVANIDSGVDWQHPSLRARYRGYGNGTIFDHAHNWFDATDEGASYPVDQEAHGTHTMGSIVGLDGIGVAPGATWMACKGLNGDGYGLSSWLHACFQFLLAPNGDPTYAPDVVNNSWGSDDGRNTEFREDVIAMRAAGIFTVFSAGNNGPKAGTVGSPGSFPESIAVGATDPEDEIAYFSSRGPSPFGGIIRPTISAPGVRIVSSVPGGIYKTLNGTSMAAPHAAGTAALLLSANPSMDIAATLYTLTSTAMPLSSTIPNNDSGYGRIDAYAAVLSILESGVISGTVRELNGSPIAGAVVTATGSSPTGARQSITRTDANGQYVMRVPFGMYTASASAFGFNVSDPVGPRLVITNHVVEFDLNLVELPTAVVRGRVQNALNNEVVTATVRALDTPKQSVSTNGCPPCRYSLDLPAGTYVLEARAVGFLVQTRTVALAAGNIADVDFSLTPVQRVAFVDSGAWYYGSQAGFFREALDAMHWAYDEYRVKQVPRDTPTITQLLQYDTVIWSAPYDSPGLVGAGKVVSEFLGAGRNLMLTGQDVAFLDSGDISSPQAYFTEKISAYVDADDSNSRGVQGAPNTLLAGKVISIEGGDGADNQQFPDVVGLLDPNISRYLATYKANVDADPSGAGVYADVCVKYKVAFYSFGFEAISTFPNRVDVMSRTLSAFAEPRPTIGVDLISRDDFYRKSAIGQPGSVVTHVLRVRNTGQAAPGSSNIRLNLSNQKWPTRLSQDFLTLKPCASAVVTLTVSIPATATINAGDNVVLTAIAEPAFSSVNPTATQTATASLAFLSKTPASLLLVDDERFTKSEVKYLEALASAGNVSVDRWDTRQGIGLASSPPITVLKQYSMVIWYNGYDWFDPVSVAEQNVLRAYLQGGGRLFLTSQAMLQYTEANAFDRQYLGVGSLDFSDVISSIAGAPGTLIGDGLIGDTMVPFPYNWNLSTAVQPMSGTQVVLQGNSGQPAGLANASLLRTGPNLQPAQWKTVFLPFAFETLTATARADLMNRTVGWLSWLGDSTLVANTATVNTGDLVTYTVTLRADANMPISAAHTVAISVPVEPGLQVVSSDLPNFTGDNAGVWSGPLQPGEIKSWQFVARVTGPVPPAIEADSTPLTATLHVGVSPAELHWSRPTRVYVGAPQLQGHFSIDPPMPAWGGSAALKLTVRNTGDLAADGLLLTVTVPTGLTLGPATSVVMVMDNAAPTPTTVEAYNLNVKGRQITWTGSIKAGGELAITYPISIPRFGPRQPLAFFNTARVEVGPRTMQVQAWLIPATGLFRMPIVMQK